MGCVKRIITVLLHPFRCLIMLDKLKGRVLAFFAELLALIFTYLLT